MNHFPLTNRTLGILGLVSAPFLSVGMLLTELYPALKQTAFDGLSGLFFMLPWMGCLVGLLRLRATGDTAFGRNIILANLATLTLANAWNLYNAVQPWANTPLFFFLDAFWPISMLAMLLVGITAVGAGTLPGWRRYVPLAVGLWLPFTALVGTLAGLLIPASGLLAMSLSGLYATVCWGLLAYIVLTTPQPVQPPQPAL